MQDLGWAVWLMFSLFTAFYTHVIVCGRKHGPRREYLRPWWFFGTWWIALGLLAFAPWSKLHLLWVYPALFLGWPVVGFLGHEYRRSKRVCPDANGLGMVELKLQARVRVLGRSMSASEVAGVLCEGVVMGRVLDEGMERHIQGMVSALDLTECEHMTLLTGLLGEWFWVARRACQECLGAGDAQRVLQELRGMLTAAFQQGFTESGLAGTVVDVLWDRSTQYERLWAGAARRRVEAVVARAVLEDALGPPGDGWQKLEGQGLREGAVRAEARSLAWRLECARRILSAVSVEG